MAKKDYIPRQEGPLGLWLANYKIKLTEHKGTLVISNADYDAQVVFIDNLIAKLVANEVAQQDAEQARENLDNQKALSVAGIRKLAQQIKKKNEYTTGIGDDLGIIGEENSIDIENAKPVLVAKKVETGWRLTFNLLGFFDAVKIFRTRPGGVKTFIAIDTSSPYIDAEPQVNGTIYTAYFMLGDNSVGLESDAITISI